jgi:peptidoglycan/xylan/chitin deacetylase (PgdA/CDA1 family)
MPSEKNLAARVAAGAGDSGPRVAVTIDVEWACAEVIQDVVRLLDERNLRATFFCTHAGTPLGSHEKALHPNYHRRRNSHLARSQNRLVRHRSDAELHRQVLRVVHEMYPEAIGARSHCLFFESDLLRAYADLGLQYDSSYFLPMLPHLQPVGLSPEIVEFTIYYMDEWDLRNRATQFTLEGLRLQTAGLKVLDFHPNLVFLNAPTYEHYLAAKKQYKDPDWLLKHRHPGRRGVRSLFVDVLDYLAAHADTCSTLAELNADWLETAMKAVPAKSGVAVAGLTA